MTCTKNEIFEILKGKFHEELETKINILEQHFVKKEPDFEIDHFQISGITWKNRGKASHLKLWQCFCTLTVP